MAAMHLCLPGNFWQYFSNHSHVDGNPLLAVGLAVPTILIVIPAEAGIQF
jgi:hypothetical protein